MPGSVTAAVGIGGSIAQGIMGSDAAGKAAAFGKAAADSSNKVATDVYNTNQTNLNPFITAGQNAQGTLASLLSGGAAGQNAFQQYKNSTNYNFLLDQGLQGVAYGNAPQYNSSATEKALNNYAQGMAGNALQGYESMLQGLGTTGAQSAGVLGQLGNQYAGQFSNNTFGGANAQAQGALGQAAAMNNMIGNITQAGGFGSGFGGSGSGQSSALSNLIGGVSSFAKSHFGGGQTVDNTDTQDT